MVFPDSIRVFYVLSILSLVACRVAAADTTSSTRTNAPLPNAGTSRTSESYISDYRGLPIWHSSEEIVTRTWKMKDGKTIHQLSKEIVKVDLPDLREVLLVRYGEADSDRTVCVDFYATRELVGGETSYLLLCHDPHCPPLKTKVAFEQQDGRRFFTISGESSDAGKLKRTHHKYSYELNSQWQMVLGVSHFTWEED
jgi:hypothetical protein